MKMLIFECELFFFIAIFENHQAIFEKPHSLDLPNLKVPHDTWLMLTYVFAVWDLPAQSHPSQ